MTIEDRLAGLEARVADLEAEREILRTLHRYGHAFDYGPDEARLDCFTEDAVFDLRPSRLVPRGDWTAQGLGEIAEWVSGHSAIPENYTKHLLIEPVIRLEGDGEAAVEGMFALLFNKGGVPYVAAYGRYVDRMRRGPDGRWRFKARKVELEAADMPQAGFARARA